VVWGGDPTTDWGFDGLRSSVRQALTMGLVGVGIWGSDIGGYFSLFGDRLTPELLSRWVQFGAVSGVMRTEADGIDIPAQQRPQIWDADQIANWRRWAKLHTQLYPYLVAADAKYRRTGLPLMRQLALAYPDDPSAVARDDEFLLGPDLLAAPVLDPGATERSLYLPRGRWVDLWRSLAYREAGGGLRMGSAKVLRGAGEATVPAPLDQLPLFARAGAIVALLPADVDTLSEYPDDSTVSLGDRGDELTLLAFPRGKSSARLYEDERIRSREHGDRWALRIQGDRKRTYRLRASTKTLSHPFRPCRVSVDSEPLAASRWSFDRGRKVLSAKLRGRKIRLVAHRRCG
jgi:alpha-glucosidase